MSQTKYQSNSHRIGATSNKPKVFLSYVKEDQLEVDRVHERLTAEGFDVWNYRKSAGPGNRLQDEITKEIEKADFFLACLSEESVHKPGMVQFEVKHALEFSKQKPLDQKFIILLNIDNCQMPKRLQDSYTSVGLHRIDNLIRDMKREVREFLITRRPRVVNRLLEGLKTPLDDIREIFAADQVSILMMGPRKEQSIPRIPNDEDPNIRSENLRRVLSQLCLRSTGDTREIFVCKDRDAVCEVPLDLPEEDHLAHRAPSRELLRDFVEKIKDPAVWREYTHKPIGDILMAESTAAMYLPLKYIDDEDNRDVFGFLVSFWAQAPRPLSAEVRADAMSAINDRIIPWMRDVTVKNVCRQLESPLSRREIFELALDAALGLSGADWGCIKSACPGATIHDTEVVSAECVFHCPQFFHEGLSPKTDSAIKSIIEEGVNTIAKAGAAAEKRTDHPAKEICVNIIRDPTPRGLPRIEPRIGGKKSAVGALVVQHTSDNFLSRHHANYSRQLEIICESLSGALVRSAHEELLKSIERNRKDRRAGDLSRFIGRIIRDIFDAGSQSIEWIIAEDRDNIYRIIFKSESAGREIASLAGLYHLPAKRSTSLAYFAMKNKASMITYTVRANEQGLFDVFRLNYRGDSAPAYFEQTYLKIMQERKKEEKKTEKKNTRLVLNLGDPGLLADAERRLGDDKRGLNLFVCPIIMTSGSPLGIAVLASRDPLDQSLLREFVQAIPEVATTMYSNSHQEWVEKEANNGGLIAINQPICK